MKVLKEMRDDEQKHHDIGIDNDALSTPGYSLYSKIVRGGCRAAIWLSERA